jgi:hypothetical protein
MAKLKIRRETEIEIGQQRRNGWTEFTVEKSMSAIVSFH